MIRFSCPGCSSVFTVGDEKAGKKGKCPNCSAQFEIPEAEPTAQAPAPQSSPAPDAGSDVEIKPCPGCKAKLSVATSDIGLDVECPYCKTVYKALKAGSAAAVADVKERPSSRRRKDEDEDVEEEDDRPRRRRRRDDDDEDDDDYDDAPRSRRRRSSRSRGSAMDAVKGPATALIVVGILATIFGVLNITTNATGFGRQNNPLAGQNPNAAAIAVGNWVGAFVSLIYGIVVMMGGIQMKSLSNRVSVYIGVIFALLPCIPCCLFGLPFGIWALVVLNREDVKRGFSS